MNGHDLLQQALDEKCLTLRETVGPRYASVMEGYVNMVSILNAVEDFFKDCKKSVRKFVPSDSQMVMESMREELIGMEKRAVLLSNAALAMAARIRIFRDTVVYLAGGDLLDLIEGDDDKPFP